MSEVRTFFRYCPSCGKRFHIKLVDKRLVKDSKETRVEKVRASSGYMVGNRGQYTMPQVLVVDVPTTIEVEDFEYSYKCGHCGHVWTEMHTEEFEVK